MEEIGDARIIAIAIHNLAGGVFSVVAKLALDVGKLRVEFIVLLPFGVSQASIQRHEVTPA